MARVNHRLRRRVLDRLEVGQDRRHVVGNAPQFNRRHAVLKAEQTPFGHARRIERPAHAAHVDHAPVAQHPVHLQMRVPADAQAALAVEQGVARLLVRAVRLEQIRLVVAGDGVIADDRAVALRTQVQFSAANIAQEFVVLIA